METLLEAIERMVPSKVEKNIEAAHEAYKQAKIYEAKGID
jgi:Pyruvate/2-oxoacid:ferredoxin oxidoreductase gamma subunit